MPSFADKNGTIWDVGIDPIVALKIRGDCDQDFLKGDDVKPDSNTLIRLRSDPIISCRILFLLCERQCIARNTTEEAFYLQVLKDEQTIEKAMEALIRAVLDFTPPRLRKLLETAVATMNRIQDMASKAATEKLQDPQLERDMEAMIERTMDRAMTRLSSVSSSRDSAAFAQQT